MINRLFRINNQEAWNGRGLTLVSKGQLDLALSCYKKALGIDNSIALIWNNIGTYYFLIGEYEKAYNHFLKLIELEPSVLAYYNLCSLFFQKGESYVAFGIAAYSNQISQNQFRNLLQPE